MTGARTMRSAFPAFCSTTNTHTPGQHTLKRKPTHSEAANNTAGMEQHTAKRPCLQRTLSEVSCGDNFALYTHSCLPQQPTAHQSVTPSPQPATTRPPTSANSDATAETHYATLKGPQLRRSFHTVASYESLVSEETLLAASDDEEEAWNNSSVCQADSAVEAAQIGACWGGEADPAAPHYGPAVAALGGGAVAAAKTCCAANAVLEDLSCSGSSGAAYAGLRLREDSVAFRIPMLYDFGPSSIAVGLSYFVRLVAEDAALWHAASSSTHFKDFLAVRCPPTKAGAAPQKLALILDPVRRESALLATYLTCVYMAAKVVEYVPAPRLLPTMLCHVYSQEVSVQQANDLELRCLEGLHWRMGPFFTTTA